MPEYRDWDCLIEDRGILAGIQLKLELNVKAISQCVLCGGVDFKFIVFNTLPTEKKWDMLYPILKECRIIPVYFNEGIFHSSEPMYSVGSIIIPPSFNTRFKENNSSWLLKYRHHPAKRIKLPEGDFDIPAGKFQPTTISDWRIAAVHLEKRATRNGGWVLLEDFLDFKVKPMRAFFRYDRNTKTWRLFDSPSRHYPHIAKGLESTI